MSRPRPRVLLQATNEEGRTLQVCEADAIYAVCYKGQPFMLKNYHDINSNYIGPKYAKTSFPNSGHAFNQAEKLNTLFNTSDFTVYIMTPSRTISE